ncbi:hypothetical protein GCM10017620_24790 [Brevundimonas intermedia]|uniref:DUF4224 domain-containing protein n=1 Tax=Brevundimonas intermedia TaxID=74315 RepID=A0ABQ5TA65_9CAUL|nr:hypothetical protein [Brevundimonas intermedia]GLK49506.1 hypothetical protein GCM10017620_24790 [Brevundimonas intermedia]
MSVARITQNEADAVARLRAAGRKDRQIETMLGLTYGLLGKPYRVGDDERPIMDRDHRGNGWRYPTKPEDKT